MVKLDIKKVSAFTLIELMIVIAIMSIALTLVGPNLFKSYQKAQYQTDMIKLRENMKAISRKAFLNNRAVKLQFSTNKIQYQYLDSNKPLVVKIFEHITFPAQTVLISSSGFIDKFDITITTGKTSKKMSLREINAL